MFFLKKNTDELHCVNYLFISVASVQVSGYAQYKLSIKNETTTTIFAHLSLMFHEIHHWIYVHALLKILNVC